MRHFFRKKDKAFFEDIAAFIATARACESEAHAEAVEAALLAADDYFDATVTVPCAPVYQEAPPRKSRAAQAKPADFQTIKLPEKQPSFADNLFAAIDQKQLKDSTVYKRADIDRRLFSKIRSDENYHPSKPTAIKLCLALELTLSEAERLLETAGYCLSLSDTGDLIIRYCFEKGIFRLIEVNEALDYFGQPIL